MEPNKMHTQPKPAFSPEGLFVITIGVGILLLLVMTAPSSSHPPSVWTIRRNAMKQICMAVGEYREVHGVYPPVCVYDDKGQPSQSWRVLILPYLDWQPLYDKYHFDEPWNSLHNFQLRELCPVIYRNLNGNMETGDDIHSRHLMTIVRRQDLRDLEATSGFLNKQGDNQEIPLIIDLTGTEKFWIEPWDFEFQASSIPPGEPQGRGYMVGSCETSVVTVLSRMDLFKLMIKYENWKSREAADE